MVIMIISKKILLRTSAFIIIHVFLLLDIALAGGELFLSKQKADCLSPPIWILTQAFKDRYKERYEIGLKFGDALDFITKINTREIILRHLRGEKEQILESVDILGLSGDPRAIQPLLVFLDKGHPPLPLHSIRTIEALVNLKSRDVVSRIREYMNHLPIYEFRRAFRALKRLGLSQEQLISILVDILNDDNARMRSKSFAATGLHQMHTDKAFYGIVGAWTAAKAGITSSWNFDSLEDATILVKVSDTGPREDRYAAPTVGEYVMTELKKRNVDLYLLIIADQAI